MAECTDPKCAVHGKIKARGNIFTGKVESAKSDKTVSVKRFLTHYIPKYERRKKVVSVIRAHNPACIGAKEGEWVKLGETRKISKTKSFVVLKKITKEEEKK